MKGRIGCVLSVERSISLIASVEISLAKLLFAPIFMATVDFPVPVAPAIISNRGGLLAMVLAVVPARPTVRAMADVVTCQLYLSC